MDIEHGNDVSEATRPWRGDWVAWLLDNFFMGQTISIAPPFAGVASDHLVVRRVGGLRVAALAPYVDDLLDADSPNWLNLADNADATLIKRNAARDVHRIRFRNQTFFVKTYRPVTHVDALKQLWRGPACKTEWRIAQYVRKYGIDAVQPVAFGFVTARGRIGPSVLISVEIKAVHPLNDIWARLNAEGKRCSKRVVDALGDAMARAIARAHQCGFEHADMHAGNLLVQLTDPHRPRVIFVDLQNARIGRPVSNEAVVRNLAQLNQWFQRHSTVTQRLRFLDRYMKHREEFADLSPHARRIDLSKRHLTAAMQRLAAENGRKLAAKRDRRAHRDGKYFARIRLPGRFRGHMFRQIKHPPPHSIVSGLVIQPEQWRRCLGRPEDLFADIPEANRVKESHSAEVVRASLRIDESRETIDVICKRVLPRNGLKKVWYLFRPSRNMQNFFRGHGLLHRHLPTPPPLLAIEKRMLGLRTDAVLITEFVQDGLPLNELIVRLAESLDPQDAHHARQKLIAALARLFKQITQRLVAHRDFKAENLLVRWPDAPAGLPCIYLIDLDGIRFRKRLKPDDVPRMLMRLSLSLETNKGRTRTDHLRFLKATLRGPGRSDADWKPTWRRIAALADRKRQQKERRRQWKLKHYGRE